MIFLQCETVTDKIMSLNFIVFRQLAHKYVALLALLVVTVAKANAFFIQDTVSTPLVAVEIPKQYSLGFFEMNAGLNARTSRSSHAVTTNHATGVSVKLQSSVR